MKPTNIRFVAKSAPDNLLPERTSMLLLTHENKATYTITSSAGLKSLCEGEGNSDEHHFL